MIIPAKAAAAFLAAFFLVSSAPSLWAGEEAGEGEEPPPNATATARDVLLEGITLFDNKSYDKASKCFDAVIEKEPENPLARFYRGLIRVVKIDYAGALDDFNAVVKARPKAARAYIQRGRAFMALNRFAESQEDFKKALETDPDAVKTDSYLKLDLEQAADLAEADKKVGVGKGAPDLKLMSASGKPAALADHKGKEYVVLVFYTTYASPECRALLSQFNESQEEMGKRGAVVMALSTDALKWGIELVENKGFTIRILSDEDGKTVAGYGLSNVRFKSPPISLPATVIVDKEGKVAYRKVSYDPRDRDGPEKILKELDGLIKKEAESKKKEGEKPAETGGKN